MEPSEIQARRSANQRRILLGLIAAVPEILETGKNFPLSLNRHFRVNSRFGSRDRRLYREFIYTYLRYQPWLDSLFDSEKRFLDTLITLATPTPEVAKLYPTLGTSIPAESPDKARHRLIGKSDEDLADLIPDWFANHVSQPLDVDDLLGLFSRPPLWIRVQKGNAEAIASQLTTNLPLIALSPTIHATIPDAIRCPPDFPVQDSDDYKNGNIEIQDISSQVLLQLVEPKPIGEWFDACAGAGGKTLQLAKLLGSAGRVIAYDPRSQALDELIQRSKRSGFRNISVIRQKPTSHLFEGVLVDAPCSGSGTWRRHPYLIRQTSKADVHDAVDTQFALLSEYSELVKPNGLLVYCTCSLSRFENEEVAKYFLQARPDFQRQPLAQKFGLTENGLGITVYPKAFDGDGLFVASFRRSS